MCIAARRAGGDSSRVAAKSAVIGAGAMGHGIGEVLAREYPEVWLYDPDAATLERAVALIRESVERLRRHGLITARWRATRPLGCTPPPTWSAPPTAPAS